MVGETLLCRIILYNDERTEQADTVAKPTPDKLTTSPLKVSSTKDIGNVFSWASVQVHGEFAIDPGWISLPSEPKPINRPNRSHSGSLGSEKKKNPTALVHPLDEVGNISPISTCHDSNSFLQPMDSASLRRTPTLSHPI